MWYVENVAQDWAETVREIGVLLQEEEKLLEIVQLVGSDALPEKQQITLATARLIREGFLQQNAFHETDSYCSLKKSYGMMKAILYFHKLASSAAEQGVRVTNIVNAASKDKLFIVKYETDADAQLKAIEQEMEAEFKKLVKKDVRS